MKSHHFAVGLAGRVAVVGLAGLIVLGGCGGGGAERVPARSPSGSATHTLSPRDPDTYAEELFVRTNTARADDGLPAVVESTCARDAALRRADALVGAVELTHAPLDEVITQCAPASAAAENLSRAAAEPADVVAAWLQSPGHRSNLLDPDLADLGVGCVLDGGEMLCSQVYLGR